MNKKLAIKYNMDNSKTSIKVIIYLFMIFIFIILLFIYKNWEILFLGITTIWILKKLITKPDGEFIIFYKGNKMYLKENLDGSILEQNCTELLSHDFSWHYIHTPMSGTSETSSDGGHANVIQLKLELDLSSGDKFLFYEELYPWQETPKNWKYKILEKEKYSNIFFINGKFQKLKEDFEKLKQ